VEEGEAMSYDAQHLIDLRVVYESKCVKLIRSRADGNDPEVVKEDAIEASERLMRTLENGSNDAISCLFEWCTKRDARSIIEIVRAALVAAGERECPTKRTRSTGRVRYRPENGFRIYTTASDLRSAPTPLDTRRVGIGHAWHQRNVLNRYASALRAAGFDVVIDSTVVHKNVIRVWLKTPTPLADFRGEQTHDE
jgi:hypothetical protein